MTAARDFLGQKYGVGDYVAYATTHVNSAVLKLGKVHKIELYEVNRYDPVSGETRWTYGYKVGVEWLEGGYQWSGPSKRPSGKPRLSYPNYKNIVFVSHYEPVR